MRFIRGLWRFIRQTQSVVGTLVFLLVVGLIISLFFMDSGPKIPEKAALRLALSGVVVEQQAEIDPFAAALGSQVVEETLLRDVQKALKAAKQDARIQAVTLELDGFVGAGPAVLRALGQSITDFKTSKKPVIAHATYMGNSQYYVASFADTVLVEPIGGVVLTGLGSYNVYLKDILDRFNVNVNVFRVGEFKAAVEPYTRTDMSPEARQNIQGLFDGVWSILVKDIADQRRAKGLQDLNAVINGALTAIPELKGDVAAYALKSKLVDGLETRGSFTDRMIKLVGEGKDKDGLTSFNQVSLGDYLATQKPDFGKGDAVAVVYAVGEIVDGDHPAGVAGGDTVALQIRKAVDDADTKAIVLRVDSPGGSVTASEVIRLEIERAKAKQIPVVASYGTLAASGGYWISANANEIWADPSTITGSIGIFALIPTFERTLKGYGVNTDGVGTTPLSDFGNVTRPIAEPVRQVVQASVEHGYTSFLNRVAQGRSAALGQTLAPTRVNEIGQGQVWTGQKALELKLVDRLGSLDEAIAAAAKRANLTKWRVNYVEAEEEWQNKLIKQLIGERAEQASVAARMPAASWAFASQLQRLLGVLGAQPRLSDPQNLYAWCLECAVFASPKKALAGLETAGFSGSGFSGPGFSGPGFSGLSAAPIKQ
jgi:protease IV